MTSDVYVKAIYDFTETQSGELELHIGDIVRILQEVDSNWLFGDLNGKTGRFPKQFVQQLNLPKSLPDDQKLFACCTDFLAQDPKDLTIHRGDIVIGIRPVDLNWWYGKRQFDEGIFPLSHVYQLKLSIHVNTSDTTKTILGRVRVLSDVDAQLDDELSLIKGEVIDVFDQLEDGAFLYGMNSNGKKGKFLSNFVEVIDGDLKLNIVTIQKRSKWWDEEPDVFNKNASNSDNNKLQESKIIKENNENIKLPCYEQNTLARAVYSFMTTQDDELAFDKGEIINLIRPINDEWVEGNIDNRRGMFPLTFVELISNDFTDQKYKTENDIKFDDSQSEQLAIAMYPYCAADNTQLNIIEGESITILHQIDKDWVFVRNSLNEKGICPVSYLNISLQNSNIINNSEISSNENMDIEKYNIKDSLLINDNNNLINNEEISLTNQVIYENTSKPCQPLPKPKIKANVPQATLSPSVEKMIESRLASESVGVNKIPPKLSESPKPMARKSLPPQRVLPTRPAPPKPIPARRSEPKRPPPPCVSSLYTPGSSNVDTKDGQSIFYHDYNEIDHTEEINDLESRMKLIDNEINAYQTKVCSEDDTIDKESIEGILKGLQEDKESILSSLYDIDPNRKLKDENIAKRKRTRHLAISELISTEEIYLRDIIIAYESFLQYRLTNKTKTSYVDINFLMGNLENVVALSKELYDNLYAEYEKCEENIKIGQCFVKLENKLKTIYSAYCYHHDGVLNMLEKYEGDPKSKEVLDSLKKLMSEHDRAESSALYQVSAILAKPFQRILKYKLLLENILKSTEIEHCDYPGLVEAIKSMSNVTTSINELKRGKDLVMKYRKPNEPSLSDRMSKVSMHSTIKKLNRFSQLVAGVQIQDEQFNREETRLNNLHKLLIGFVQNLTTYMRQCHEVVRRQEGLASDLSEFCDEESKQVEKYTELHSRIGSNFIEIFKINVSERVLEPINTLLSLFAGPLKLVKKRRDKLLDYEAERVKSYEMTVQTTDALNLAKKNYEALNAQLLDELPKLLEMSEATIKLCLTIFLRLQSKFNDDNLKAMYDLLDLDSVINIGDPIGTDAAMNIISQLNFFNKENSLKKSFKARKSEKSSSPVVQVPTDIIEQTDEDKMIIQNTYPTNTCKVVKQTTATNFSELNLSPGTLVGVVKEFDPLGSKDKWFVDTGRVKGLVPSASLIKHTFQTETSSNSLLLEPTHRAVFKFDSRTSTEISVEIGDCVVVLQNCDSHGNSEWWYVQKSDGSSGYAPSNYFYQIT